MNLWQDLKQAQELVNKQQTELVELRAQVRKLESDLEGARANPLLKEGLARDNGRLRILCGEAWADLVGVPGAKTRWLMDRLSDAGGGFAIMPVEEYERRWGGGSLLPGQEGGTVEVVVPETPAIQSSHAPGPPPTTTSE